MIKCSFSKLYILFTILCIACCESSDISSPDYMTLDDIRYVKKFPRIFQLNQATEVDWDIIGMQNFCIHDSLLIVATNDKDGLWSFVSLTDGRLLGKFLSQGNGPYEFFQSPSVVRNIKFIEKNNELSAVIYDSNRGKLYEINIEKSIKDDHQNIYTLKDSLPPFLFNFIMIDNRTFLCKEINNTETKQIRYVMNDGIKKSFPLLDKLNRATIGEGEDFNILSTITKQSGDNGIIVESPIGLNYINLYTLDGTLARSICVGDKLYDISKIRNKNGWERIYTFSDLRLFSGFFGVLQIDEDMKTFQTKRIKFPSILLFSWTGEPLAEIRSDHFITAFDIDFTNKCLYALDHQTDIFYKYDIRDILEKLE